MWRISRTVALCVVLVVPGAGAGGVWHDAAYVIHDPAEPWPYREGNEAINAAKRRDKTAGCILYAYVRNAGDGAATLAGLTWNGETVEALVEKRTAVWWRLAPPTLPPGVVGEVVVRLRGRLDRPGQLVVELSNGRRIELLVDHRGPAFRIESLAFAPDRRTAYLYIESQRQDAPLPTEVLLDGRSPLGMVRWLGAGYTGRLRVACVYLDAPLELGSWHTWTVAGGDARAGAATRVFPDVARFGSYGFMDIKRFADNGLGTYYSFGQLGREALDAAQAHGIRAAFYISDGTPPEDRRGHPAIYGYNLHDEPDVGDYSARKDVPMHLRPGTLAPDMVEQARRCAESDATKPVLLTLDLTFTPANYYIYGPIADMTTPDCYPVTIGQPLSFLRDCAAHAKRATAPRPFGFVYQSCWEHFAKDQGRYVGRAEILAKGFDRFTDPEKTRGFGRPPTPSEIRIQMMYALGSGARALWAYIDATELSGTLLFQGTQDLPENWKAVGDNSRALRHVERYVNLAHPIAWAHATGPKLWVRTLICGDAAALVVVVNEDYRCDKDGFSAARAQHVKVTFPALPWATLKRIAEVRPDGLVETPSQQQNGGLAWAIPCLTDTALYLVTGVIE